jgi:hypothetical protein
VTWDWDLRLGTGTGGEKRKEKKEKRGHFWALVIFFLVFYLSCLGGAEIVR